ncbi:toxin secretion/phage lysis holin [Lachnospiraceae bacterium 28-4]|nr:toxin secretion/phage lysis holin [Lachnospiraceae bacterium 28-4]
MSMFLFRAQWIVLVVKRGIVEDVLGGWDGLLSALILFMVVEYLTQILVAILNKKRSNEIGFCGIAKKVSIIFLVAVGNVIDVLVIQNGSIIRTAVIFFYLSNEGIIIIENVAILGLPIPQRLKDILEQLKDGKK